MPKRGTTAKGAPEQRRSSLFAEGEQSGSLVRKLQPFSRSPPPEGSSRMTQGVRRKAGPPAAHGRSGVTDDTSRGDPLSQRLLEDDWRSASRATRNRGYRAASHAARRVDQNRESGEERPRTRRDCPKGGPVRVKSTGMRDRAVCSRISSNAEAPRAGPRDPGKDLADPGLGLIVGRPSGSVVDGRSGSRRGRREREVILAWKRGSSSLFASCGRIASLHGGVASGKARPTTERLDAGNRNEKLRASRETGKCQGRSSEPGHWGIHLLDSLRASAGDRKVQGVEIGDWVGFTGAEQASVVC